MLPKINKSVKMVVTNSENAIPWDAKKGDNVFNIKLDMRKITASVQALKNAIK